MAISKYKHSKMLKEVTIANFYSFNKTIITMHPATNILIGINGSGKSNFLKALKLLKEGVAGIGLKKLVLDYFGGFDNAFFKGTNKIDDFKSISFQYKFDGQKISQDGNGFNFTDDIIYQINIIKSASLSNYYIQEKITNEKGFVYLDFSNGIGHLTEKVLEKSNKTNLVRYADFDPQELAMKEISDTDRYYALTTIKKAIKDIVVYDYFDTTPKCLIRKCCPPLKKGFLRMGQTCLRY